MFPIHAHFPITVCLQPFVPADIEAFRGKEQERPSVFFKQLPDGDLLFIMKFTCFLFVPQKKFFIELFNLREMRNRDKQVCAVEINFPFHVAFLPAGVWIAETYPL